MLTKQPPHIPFLRQTLLKEKIRRLRCQRPLQHIDNSMLKVGNAHSSVPQIK
jgi:hypothetical protein